MTKDKAPLPPVLIVDDEKDNLQALNRLLRTQYAVTTADSPLEALKLVMKNEFHVIVSDQRMPEMTGVEFLEKVKTVRPASVRILLTGYTDLDSVIGAINRGNIYRYVAKPWDPEDLKLTLRQAEEAYRLRKELELKNEALERTNRELTQALADLELLDRAKARFLSLVRHELNTPLTSVNAFIELLRESQTGLSVDIQKAISSLHGASQRLSEIVGEVLDFVRVEAATDWRRESFDWSTELSVALKALEKDRKKRHVDIVFKGAQGVRSVCDAEKTRLALRKILEDTLSRSPEKKKIHVEIAREDGDVVCRVRREGAPLTEEAFTPLAPSGEILHHQRNLGLRLPLARAIVERQGGTLRFAASRDGATDLVLTYPMAG